MESLKDYFSQQKLYINDKLIQYVYEYTDPGRLQDAMLYSIEAGGKRLRPILLMSTAEAFGAEEKRTLAAACALEMIHTYSLIHDDLPSMDNDDLRRGKPTSHIMFDEATATLAGDALLTLSFQVISEDPNLEDGEKVYLLRELASASGARGMVAGQMHDMQSEDRHIPLHELETIHKNKTGKLIRFAILAGAYLGQASEESMDQMKVMGDALGLIFQIQDDILDVTGDADVLGKPTGSDENNLKSTYPKLLGLDGAIQQKANYVDSAQNALRSAGVDGTLLSELIHYLSSRDR
ncbi:polyprenyl synthetase family protein [Halobacillus rhizosphaerae]|uniref:polyprenyl synthetase family protein n=1 Tax=Halobacillus rhizosphaerae TaxID=3064889 RepID=UPI00398AFF81